MSDLLKDLLKSGEAAVFDSLDEFMAAAKAKGYSDEEIEEALADFDGFPLDDDDLEEVAGGLIMPRPCSSQNLGNFRR